MGIGFGGYFLEPKDGEKAEFVSHMIGNFCDHKGQQPSRRIMQCNVVMVRGETGGIEERNARDSYKEFLGKPCMLKDEAKQVPADNALHLRSDGAASAFPGPVRSQYLNALPDCGRAR